MRSLVRFAAVLAVATFAASAVPSAAKEVKDAKEADAGTSPTLQMFDNFFLSLVAARLCDNPDARTMDMFTRNLVIVQQITINYYKRQDPKRTTNEIFGILNNRAMALDQGLKATISEKGCADPEVINLVHLFDIQAHMDLLKEEKKP